MQRAFREAKRWQHDFVGTEHLLYGLLCDADGPAVTLMWQHYLASELVPVGAVPARADDLAGVASALITCSELDPLRDEAVDYALRLMWAGVATELHVFPGTCHGFDSLLPEWETSQRLFDLQGAALRRALHESQLEPTRM